MKAQLIAAGAGVAAVGVLGLGIPAAEHATSVRQYAYKLTDTQTPLLGDVNSFLLGLEGVSSPPAELPSSPLGMSPDGNFYTFTDQIAPGLTIQGPTPDVELLNSSLVTGINKLVGIGDTNGYIGLSPTVPGGTTFIFNQQGAAFDQGLQALLTGFNQPVISLEGAVNGVEHLIDPSATPVFDPATLDLDPTQLTVNTVDLSGLSGLPTSTANLPDIVNSSVIGDFATALQDFGVTGDLAGGVFAPFGDLSTIFGDLLVLGDLLGLLGI